MRFLKTENTCRVLFRRADSCITENLIVVVVTIFGFLGQTRCTFRMEGLTFGKLRVICRRFAIENANLLMSSEGLFPCVQEACGKHLIPYKVVTPQLRLRQHELCEKHTVSVKGNTAVGGKYAKVFLP